MADVDLCVYRGDAAGKSLHDNADGHAYVQVTDHCRNYKLIASYLAAIASPPLGNIEGPLRSGFQRPGISKWHEGHAPSRREFSSTSCQERRIRIWPQPGQKV